MNLGVSPRYNPPTENQLSFIHNLMHRKHYMEYEIFNQMKKENIKLIGWNFQNITVSDASNIIDWLKRQ